MIGSLICSFLVLYQASFIIRKNSFEKAIIFYLIFAMISPNLNLGGISISYEIIGFPFILVHYIMITKKIPIPIDTIGIPFTVYSALIIVISLISGVIFSNDIPIVGMFAFVRYTMIFQMERMGKLSCWVDSADKVLSVTLLANVILSIIQILVPRSVNLFVNLYAKASSAVLYNIQTMGYFNRAVGTFGSPTLLGPFALICFSFYFAVLFSKNRNINVYIKLVSSLVLGALSLSKAFIIGIPIMTLLILFSVRKQFKLRNIVSFFLLILSVLLIVHFGYTFLIQKTAINSKVIEYYFGMVSDPIKALQTRYLAQGNLQDSFAVIINNPIFGVRLSSVKGEFTGDSTYVQLLHNTGIIGLLVMIIFFIGVIKFYYRKRDEIAFVVIVAGLIAGIGIPIFTEIMFIVPLGFSLAKQKNYYVKIKENVI